MGLAPAPAAAGPWDPPPQGQVIVQTAYAEEAGRTLAEAQAYLETPTPDGAAVTKLWTRREEAGVVYEALAAQRRRLPAPENAALAVQAGFVARDGLNAGPEAGVEARLQAGYGFANGAYAAAEAGGRFYETGFEPQAEATLGFAGEAALGFLQLRYDETADGEGFSRAEAGLVLFNAAGWGLQIGARAGLSHEESGLILGVWRRPGRP